MISFCIQLLSTVFFSPPYSHLAFGFELQILISQYITHNTQLHYIQAKDPEFLTDLETNFRPDLCITAAYGQYLPKRFLAIPKYGTLNIHPSLLPRWRGASPVQRSLEAGDNPVGVSVLFTVSKMDAGPIVSQTEETIDENDEIHQNTYSHLGEGGCGF